MSVGYAYDHNGNRIATFDYYMGHDALLKEATCSANGSISLNNINKETMQFKYAWSNGATTPSVTALAPGNYSVTITSGILPSNFQCIQKFYIEQDTIIKPPFVSASANPEYVCPGKQTILSATGALTYKWVTLDEPSVIIGQSSTKSVNVIETASYVVTGTDINGCTDKDTVMAHAYITPAFLFIIKEGNLLISSSSANSYQWYLNSKIIPEATEQEYEVKESGEYFFKITTKDGCIMESEHKDVIFTGIEENGITDAVLNVVPNPFNSTANISYKISQPSLVTIEIFNVVGQRVVILKANEKQENGEYQYQFSPEQYGGAEGAYVIKLSVNGVEYVKRVTYIK